MVWDLQPTLNITSAVPSPGASGQNASPPPNSRPPPTAYVIAFPHPLITVGSHPGSSKEFLVSDCRGSVFLTDWRTDPLSTEQGSWRHSTLVELIDPHALSDSLLGKSYQNMGFAAWRRDNADMYVHSSFGKHDLNFPTALGRAMDRVLPFGTCQNYVAASRHTRELASKMGGMCSGTFSPLIWQGFGLYTDMP